MYTANCTFIKCDLMILYSNIHFIWVFSFFSSSFYLSLGHPPTCLLSPSFSWSSSCEGACPPSVWRPQLSAPMLAAVLPSVAGAVDCSTGLRQGCRTCWWLSSLSTCLPLSGHGGCFQMQLLSGAVFVPVPFESSSDLSVPDRKSCSCGSGHFCFVCFDVLR